MTDTATERTPAEIESAIAKNLAEAEKAKAEAEAARTEAAHRAHELDRAQIYAQVEALAHDEARIQHLRFLEAEANRVVDDDHLRVYRFSDVVSSQSAAKCMAVLDRWARLDKDVADPRYEIIFNSPGGSVIDGMALFDRIVTLSRRGGGHAHITVGSLGYAASMAGILLQSGDHRWIGSNSYLMIHEVSSGAMGKIGEIKDEVDFLDKISEQVVDIFVSRSDGKITKRRFKNLWDRKDVWLLAGEALDYGFVDEVR